MGKKKDIFKFINFFWDLGSISQLRKIISGNIAVLMLLELLNGLSRWTLQPLLQPFLLKVGFSIVFIGALSSFRSIISAIFQPILGKYSDIYGRKPIIIFGSTLQTIALFLLALIENSNLLILSVLILGIAESFVTPSFNVLMMESVKKEFRITAYNLVKTITFGMGIVAPVFGGIITKLYGFQIGFILLTIICLVNSIAYALFLEETVSNVKRVATIDLFRADEALAKRSLYILSKQFRNALARVKKIVNINVFAGLKNFFTPELKIRGLYIVWAMDSFAWGAFMPIRSAILADYFQFSTNMIGIILATSSAVVVFVSIPLGSLADRIDRRAVLCASEIFAGLSLIGYIFSSNFYHVVFVQIFNGIALASWYGPIQSLLADTVSQNNLGVATGRLFAVGTIAGLSSPTLGGLIYSYFGFHSLCIFCLLFVIINIILIPIVVQEAGGS